MPSASLTFLFFSFKKKTCCHAVAVTTLVRDWFLYMLKESVSFHVLARAKICKCDARESVRAQGQAGRHVKRVISDPPKEGM